MAEGFIPLSRALLDWDWHDEPKTAWLYVVMLMMANHEETRWRGETLRRGQLLTGRKQLSTVSGLTEDEVRTALSHLKKTGDVSVATRNKYSIVTMLRYEEHCPAEPQQEARQIPGESSGKSPAISPAISPADPQQVPSNAPADPHIQKLKNLKNLKKAADDAPAGEEGFTAYNTPDMAAIEDMWQRMGNRVTANDLFRFEQAIADGHSAADILDAMKEADEHGARESWAYVKTVLANWKHSGRREKPPKEQEEHDPYAGLPVFGSWDS